jgi:hypothetical protein
MAGSLVVGLGLFEPELLQYLEPEISQRLFVIVAVIAGLSAKLIADHYHALKNSGEIREPAREDPVHLRGVDWGVFGALSIATIAAGLEIARGHLTLGGALILVAAIGILCLIVRNRIRAGKIAL